MHLSIQGGQEMEIYQNKWLQKTYLFVMSLVFAYQPWLSAHHSHHSHSHHHSHHHHHHSHSHHSKHIRGYDVTNIVSDISGLALQTDPNLQNAWGLFVSSKGNLIVAINGTGTATSYTPAGLINFTINCDDDPTGLVRNRDEGAFLFGAQNLSANLLFASESGQILAFNRHVDPNNAIVVIDRSSFNAVYKGIAVASDSEQSFLYATDFHNGHVDMFDQNFNLVQTFTDTTIPAGFAPFNIANINGFLYVTFAKQDAARHDDVAGLGNGFVDIFNPDGTFVKRLISEGALNSPWGLAVAPKNFGDFSKSLLVGNFGDGHIHAYNRRTGKFQGELTDADGNPLTIDGLWALQFQQDQHSSHSGHRSAVLYFTSGPNHEADGLVGSITPHRP